ncbi:hypothetical protein FACS1894217_03270 [Clostridia bacterium]|nr:hypothetical protein FACS1894217_03270 [Clostridia bacterium]
MILRERFGVSFFTSDLITVPHGFSTRLGGVSDAPFDTLNLGSSAVDSGVLENYERFAAAVGIQREDFVFTRQVHGDHLEWAENRVLEDCDGLLTRRKNRALTVVWADCVPILLQGENCVAAVHSGWRGTKLNIAAKAVKMMESSKIRAAIGPCICKKCFEVQNDVACEFPAYAEKISETHWQIDLRDIVKNQLKSAGVSEIDVSEQCTCCEEKLFFSHRRNGQPRGTHSAVIAL